MNICGGESKLNMTKIPEKKQQLEIHSLEANEKIERQKQLINEQKEAIAQYENQITELEEQIDEKPYEEQHAKRGFFLSGFSIDEGRISALIICLFCAIIFGGFTYSMNGDISVNYTNIVTALIYAIAGVNITNSVITTLGNKNSESKSETKVQTNNTIRTIDNKN